MSVETLKRDIAHAFHEIDEVIDISGFLGKNNIENAIDNYFSDLKYVDKIQEIVEMKRCDETKPHYEHSLRVGALSWMALKYLGKDFLKYVETECGTRFNEEMMAEYCIAGILHDCGKLKVNKKNLVKPGRLTDQEFEDVKSHREHGISVAEDILKEDGIRAPLIKAIIFAHHDYNDPNGYSKVLDVKRFNGLINLVALADSMDAPLFRGIYQRECRPSDLHSYINLISTQNSPKNAAMIKKLKERVGQVRNEDGSPYFRRAEPGRFEPQFAKPYEQMLIDHVRSDDSNNEMK